MANKNFTNRSVSVIGKNAKKEFTLFSECIRMVRRMFEAYETDPKTVSDDLRTAIEDCINSGVNAKTDLNLQFIVNHLNGTNWVVDGVIVEHVKGENVPVGKWTPNKVMNYVRKANRQQLLKLGLNK